MPISAEELDKLGIKVYEQLLRKRINAIRKYLLQADLERIRENQIIATC